MNYLEGNHEVSYYFLPIALIAIDNRDITRHKIRHELIAQYSEDMKNSAHFPPITVFFDGSTHWLLDGLHRIYAKKAIGGTEILAEVLFRSQSYNLCYSTCDTTTNSKRDSYFDRHQMFEEILYAGNKDTPLSQDQILNRHRPRRCRN